MNGHAPTRPVWIALVAMPLLFVAVADLQVRIDAHTRSAAQEKEELLLQSGPLLKKLSLGYDSLLADIYWTRAVQYYGSRVGKSRNFQLLWPLLDVATTLDPKLVPAYRFGAIFLSETGVGGAGRTDLAVDLVKRGLAANPDVWQLDVDLGFLYYWRLKDYANAAAAYLQASKNLRAPAAMKLLAARVAEMGGSLETSRIIWSEVYESTTDQNVRKKALQELKSLKAKEDEMHLDELSEDYRNRFGRYPASIAEMRDAGLLSGIPVDPEGFPYVLGHDGKAQLAPMSPIVIEPPPKGPG